MEKIWLVGTGYMGIEYAKVLNAINIDYVAIGRGEVNAHKFEMECNHNVTLGGLKNFLSRKPGLPSKVIVAVTETCLTETVIELAHYGVKFILVEKPGVGDVSEIDFLVKEIEQNDVKLFVAYNRRFFSSIMKAENIIKDDGGLSSFTFEFTEWSHKIEKMALSKQIFDNWFLGNSTHVIDTAFFVGGFPKEIKSYKSGKLNWFPNSTFVGAGITNKDVLFSYHANWASPGRWSIEFLTKYHRIFLRPMEMLSIQELGSLEITPVVIDNTLDVKYKPGLFLQTFSFIHEDFSRLCTIEQQQQNIKKVYNVMY